MGLISLPSMMRNKYSPSLATGTIYLILLGQIIPPSIVLIILADQLGSASDQASAMRQSLYKMQQVNRLCIGFRCNVNICWDMFLGAFLPGIVLVLFILPIFCYCINQTFYGACGPNLGI